MNEINVHTIADFQRSFQSYGLPKLSIHGLGQIYEHALMKRSVHEDYFFIVHDALVLMTVKETIEWMKEKNCFHCWLLPMNGLQDRTPYSGRPVGNSPKFMPLDNSLNRDILHSLRFHCVLSRFVIDGEETDKE